MIAIIYVSIPKNQMSGPKTNEDSLANVESRKLKDETFRDSDESPIKDKKMFKGLAYYAFNQKWIISFEVQRSEKIEKIKINMTDGSQEDMLKFGTITANINGAEVKLELFQHADGNLFLPFKDKTAPTETYGGGRFLDLPLTNVKNNRLRVDFNLAYNPYCAYNEDFACPIPPAENTLPIRIEAGEKNFN